MAYTPGPLTISEAEDGSGDWCIVDVNHCIGEAYHCVAYLAYRDAEANARLWAAAPDLLAALKAVEWVDGRCPWCHTDWDHTPDCPRQAALATAEGDTP